MRNTVDYSSNSKPVWSWVWTTSNSKPVWLWVWTTFLGVISVIANIVTISGGVRLPNNVTILIPEIALHTIAGISFSQYLVAGGLVLLNILFLCYLLYTLVKLRESLRRKSEAQVHLSKLTHYLRDSQTRINKYFEGKSNNKNKDQIGYEFLKVMSDLCNKIKEYYSIMESDTSIEVAIRLAVAIQDNQNVQRVVYRTYGRSSGMNVIRSRYTEDLRSDVGIPQYFRMQSKGTNMGVLIYHDLGAAAIEGAYQITKNDKTFPGEIRSIMVSPLIGWIGVDSDENTMIGLLYINSGKLRNFKPENVDTLKVVADVAAMTISAIVLSLEQVAVHPLAGRKKGKAHGNND
jgi:hypothetical protein